MSNTFFFFHWSAGQPHAHAALLQMKEPPVGGWAPEPVWTRWRRSKKSLPLPEF